MAVAAGKQIRRLDQVQTEKGCELFEMAVMMKEWGGRKEGANLEN